MTDRNPKLNPTDGPVHKFFELSYANYFVLPRSLMQSMPLEWQRRFVDCATELQDAFEHIQHPEGWQVDAVYYKDACDLSPTEAALVGVTVEDERGERVYLDRLGREIDKYSTVAIPVDDPIPHYNRGRTYIPPRTEGGGDDA